MNAISQVSVGEKVKPEWKQALAPYQRPDRWHSIGQLCNTLIPYILLFTAMIFSLRVSYWLTLLLAVPTAGFMIRTFIIFHDCGHASFFRSQRANDWVGVITGILTFTPYAAWKHAHAIHHATAGDLDRRGVGDVKVLTIQEYLALPWWKRLVYRIFRFPPVMFGIGPALVFLVGHRFFTSRDGPRERASIIWTNLVLLGIFALMWFTIGWKAYLLVQLPIMVIGTSVGVWLFYVQHQFEGVYWARHENWSFYRAAIEGSSYYQLPRLLQWFTGNIGFHHIHHLNPRIPNYNLQKCHEENPIFRVKPLTILNSLKSFGYRLWDEEHQRLVSFGYLKTLRFNSGTNME